MLKKMILIILLIFTFSNLYSDHFQNGNLEFSNKNFEEAEVEFLSEIEKNGYDVNTLFNLGNTYIKSDKNGHALYYLYKARMINPRDPNINSIIDETEENLDLKGQFNSFNPLSRIENLNVTLIIIITLSILIILYSTMSFFNKRNNLLFKLKNITLSVLILTLIISFIGNFLHYQNRSLGITLNRQEVLISPYIGSEVTFSANEGSRVKITDKYEDFIFITDLNGRYGWINREDVGMLWE